MADGFKHRPAQHVPSYGLQEQRHPVEVQELGHTWIDVLKIDIEGAEWKVFDALLELPGPLPFTQLQVQP